MIIAVAMLGLAPQLGGIARAQSKPPKASAAEDDIRNATLLFYVAFNSALHGDLDPMSTVWSHRPERSRT